MKLDKATLHRLATLARIEIDSKEEGALLKDLEQILTWAEKLKDFDTEKSDEYFSMSDERKSIRQDEVTEFLAREKALANAPKTDGVYFQVPKVIEK